MFKFYLNGVEIQDHPDGWDNMASTIKRDDLSGGLIFDTDIRLISYGGHDLYQSLKTLWETDRFGSSTFDVYQRSGTSGYILIHSGSLFHSDMKWALVNNSVEFKVDDSSWYAKINNNKNIESSLDVPVSKNGVIITACPSFQITLHKVLNGSNLSPYRLAYKVHDVLKYLIDFMTDGTVGFQSDTFNTGGQYEGYCLISGPEMYDHLHTISPRLSFEMVFESLKKLFNLKFAITGSMTAPVIQIETSEYFWDKSTAYTLSDVPEEVLLTVATDKLYSGVSVGCNKFETTSSLRLPDILPMTTFREDSFHFQTVDNIDNILDLKYGLVSSCAAIEVVTELLSGYESYDQDTFIINYDPATNKSIQSDWVNSGHHLYNETLNNINILNRWVNSFPGDVVANFFPVNNNRFQANRTTAAADNGLTVTHSDSYIGTDGPVCFNDDFTLGFDPSGNYGGTTPAGTNVNVANSIYTAPVNGNYTFTAGVYVQITNYQFVLIGGQSYPKEVSIHFQKFNAANVMIDDLICPGQSFFNNIWNVVTGTWNTYLNAGEYVAVYLHFKYTSVPANPGNWFYTYKINPNQTVFACTGIDSGYMTIRVPAGNGYKALKINFKYPITLADYQTIRSSKSGLISVPLSGNRSIQGWVENVKFEHISGETTFSLVTDGDTISG